MAINLHAIDTNNDQVTDSWRASLNSSDLLLYASNSCSTGPLQYAIARSGTSTGFPSTTSLEFDCSEMGVQLIDLWASDGIGHESFVTTYVIVEDVFDQCAAPAPALPTGCNMDKLSPRFMTYNGVTAAFQSNGANGEYTLWGGSMVHATENNCPGFNRVRIELADQSQGVPPATSKITIPCTAGPTVIVRVWIRDAAGNWDALDTYCRLEDYTSDACDNFIPSGCNPDLGRPVLQLYDGFCTNLTPLANGAGTAELWANDFVMRKIDNCSGVSDLRIKIADGSMNPPVADFLTLTCNELGVLPIQIWGKDTAGNWGFTETYVLVQDNIGLCGNAQFNAQRFWPTRLDDFMSKWSDKRK
ncbi:MAG: hypothetical protein IPL65_18725 [Lewinellaceae bacterium]|nr:hypothetical protein [Lewinellaceae bacterium]